MKVVGRGSRCGVNIRSRDGYHAEHIHKADERTGLFRYVTLNVKSYTDIDEIVLYQALAAQ